MKSGFRVLTQRNRSERRRKKPGNKHMVFKAPFAKESVKKNEGLKKVVCGFLPG